jgi:hypothetical protein
MFRREGFRFTAALLVAAALILMMSSVPAFAQGPASRSTAVGQEASRSRLAGWAATLASLVSGGTPDLTALWGAMSGSIGPNGQTAGDGTATTDSLILIDPDGQPR